MQFLSIFSRSVLTGDGEQLVAILHITSPPKPKSVITSPLSRFFFWYNIHHSSNLPSWILALSGSLIPVARSRVRSAGSMPSPAIASAAECRSPVAKPREKVRAERDLQEYKPLALHMRQWKIRKINGYYPRSNLRDQAPGARPPIFAVTMPRVLQHVLKVGKSRVSLN